MSGAESAWSAAAIDAATTLEYVGFLHRSPFVADAYRQGFTVGVREDYTYRIDQRNVDVPVEILDNNFRDPDVDRYLDRLERDEPSIAILGDAMDATQAREYLQIAEKLWATYTGLQVIIVPKSQGALDVLDDRVVVGYPIGYSQEDPHEYSELPDWRGRRVHILGGSPPRQLEAIEQLTQPRVTGDPPADVVGVDWNGIHQAALYGESFHPDGYRRADHLSIRETVRKSLAAVRRFWERRGMWPSDRERGSPLETRPEDPVWAVDGSHADAGDLEDAIVVEYDDGRTFAYRSEQERKRVEYQEGLV